MSRSFTLIELLIVIAIVAILSVVVILALNPGELLKQARDSARMSDLNTLHKALSLYQVDNPAGSFGAASTTYISYPDSSTTCGNIGISTSTIANGYAFACATSLSYTRTDGTGWVPVNLSSITGGSPISSLPKDPVNTTSSQNYYQYLGNSSNWALSALLESTKYLSQSGQKDGGYDPGRFEKGSDLALISEGEGLVGWWAMDEGSGDISTDSSGRNLNGTLVNGPTTVSGKINGAFQFARTSDQYVDPGNISAIKGPNMTVTAWFKPGELNNNRIISSYAATASGGSDPDNGMHQRDSMMIVSTGKLRGAISSYSGCSGSGNINLLADSVDSVSVGSWSFGAITLNYPSSTIQVFLNGAYQSQATSTNMNCQSDFNYVWIGRRKTYTNMEGTLDDVRIYNRALSAAEIAAIYNATR